MREQGSSPGEQTEIGVLAGGFAAAEYEAAAAGSAERQRNALDRELEELGFRILGYIPSVPFDGGTGVEGRVV